MKQFLAFGFFLLMLSACTGKSSWKVIAATPEISTGAGSALMIDASLAKGKKHKTTRKHPACHPYHKKKYE